MTTESVPSGLFAHRREGVRLRLILVRHGDVAESFRGRCCGSSDPELSERGRDQLRWARGLLRASSAAALYSSPRRRALESAHLLTQQVPMTTDSRLSEIDFGLLEGLTYQEVAERHPEVWQTWMDNPTAVAFPGGESFSAFCARVDELLSDLRSRHDAQAVIAVTHGGVGRVVLALALGLDLRRMFRLQQSCGGVSVIDFYDRDAVVQLMNASPIGA